MSKSELIGKDVMKICVFCGSNTNVGEPYTSSALELGAEIGRRGHTLVFGGYDTALMGAVAHAVANAGGHVLGVIPVDVPYLAQRPVFPCDEIVETHDLSDRKTEMFRRSDAFIALPGSIGTLDEIFSALAEQKVGHEDARKPLGIYSVQGYYDALEAMFDQMVLAKFMDREDRSLFSICATPHETLDYVERASLHAN